MKKIILLLLGAMISVLSACGYDNDNSSTVETQKDSSYSQSSTNNEEASTDEDGDLFTIKLNKESNTVVLNKQGEDSILLSDNNPSEPVKSPNGLKAAYLSPADWEELSVLYIVDLKSGKQKKLITPDAESKPKKVIWEDDKHVLVIIGFPHGTIKIGGNIYRVNTETAQKEALTNYGDEIQITDFRIEDGTLYYSGIQYTDADMNDHKEYHNQLKLDEK